MLQFARTQACTKGWMELKSKDRCVNTDYTDETFGYPELPRMILQTVLSKCEYLCRKNLTSLSKTCGGALSEDLQIMVSFLLSGENRGGSDPPYSSINPWEVIRPTGCLQSYREEGLKCFRQ